MTGEPRDGFRRSGGPNNNNNRADIVMKVEETVETVESTIGVSENAGGTLQSVQNIVHVLGEEEDTPKGHVVVRGEGLRRWGAMGHYDGLPNMQILSGWRGL
eukprot:symbB.v1.2.014120.t1/scaffold1002.1/size145525/2